jgi:hypothetical protein
MRTGIVSIREETRKLKKLRAKRKRRKGGKKK